MNEFLWISVESIIINNDMSSMQGVQNFAVWVHDGI